MTIKVFYRPEQNVELNKSYSPSAGKPKKVVEDWLSEPTIADHISVESFEPATFDDLCLAHDRKYIDALLSCKVSNGFGNKSPDIAASLPYTAGSMIAAARYAVKHRTTAISPTSGFHHAGYKDGRGFCSVNGLVIAARKLKQEGLVSHVLIIDGDAHYGDGTDECISVTGSDWIVNITADKSYSNAREFFKLLDPKHYISKHRAIWDAADAGELLVIYQAGADAWEHDPLGSGLFSLEELDRRDEVITRLCAEHRIPLAINLAGGYGATNVVLDIHRQTIKHAIKENQK